MLLALGLALVFVVLAGSGSGTASGRLGGDFPEFYGAGRIVRSGDASHLYRAATQTAAQSDLFGGDKTGYLDFAYPPVVALAYAPLSVLPYRAAYLVQVLAMFGALALALHLVKPMVEVVRRRYPVVLAATLAFYPMFRAVGSGQNTAVAVLCVAGAWRALHDDRELVAGLWLGGLLFKPQLAVLFLLAELVTRRWRAVAGSAVVAAAIWTVSAGTMGVGWMGAFLQHARHVPSGDGSVGGGGSVSLLGTVSRFDGGPALVAVGVVASVLVGVVALGLWWRSDRAWTSCGPTRGLGLGALAAATVLASPHVIFYDARLVLIAALALMQGPLIGERANRGILGALFMIGLLGAFDKSLPVNLLLLVALAAMGWAGYLALSGARLILT